MAEQKNKNDNMAARFKYALIIGATILVALLVGAIILLCCNRTAAAVCTAFCALIISNNINYIIGYTRGYDFGKVDHKKNLQDQ